MSAPAADSGALTAGLAEWVVGRSFDQLTSRDLAQLAALILDHLACAARGSRLPWGAGLTRWASPYAGAGRSHIIGSPAMTSAPVAAMLNATAAHGMEFDDTHDPSLTHPGAAVIATALAVGEELDAEGRDVLAAIVAGYEVTARAGIATGASILERGFHPTALFGGFGAAAAACRLYGLDSRATASAWGLLLSMVGGSMQFSEDPRGTTVKRLHGGYGALHGTLAAQFARQDIDGPAGAFDGRYGLTRLFGSHDADPQALARGSERGLAIHDISLKPYPSCRLFHSTIDALREALGALPADPASVASVTVGAPAVVPLQHMMRRPTSMMAAQYSLPFVVAAAIVRGPNCEAAFAPAGLADPAVLAVADRVSCVSDPDMEAAFPQHFGTWAEVELSAGERRRVVRLDSYGTPAEPMPVAAVEAKAAGLFEGAGLDIDVGGLLRTIRGLAGGGPVTELMASLAHPAG